MGPTTDVSAASRDLADARVEEEACPNPTLEAEESEGQEEEDPSLFAPVVVLLDNPNKRTRQLLHQHPKSKLWY